MIILLGVFGFKNQLLSNLYYNRFICITIGYLNLFMLFGIFINYVLWFIGVLEGLLSEHIKNINLERDIYVKPLVPVAINLFQYD
jgi:hypothetical protein